MKTSTPSRPDFASVASCSSAAPHALLRLSAGLCLFLAPIVYAQVPAGLALVDVAGRSIHIGNSADDSTTDPIYMRERPVRRVIFTKSFYLGETEVTFDTWTTVATWALAHGYPVMSSGQNGAVVNGSSHPGRPATTVAERQHPVTCVTFYDVITWCNARSEMEGLTPCYTFRADGTVVRSFRTYATELDCAWAADGYRLPTSAEWEYAARGGVDDGRRFPWGEFITHENDNYRSNVDAAETYPYDRSPTQGYHPVWNGTAPAGTFPATGFGLHEMAGNVSEWVWDSTPANSENPYVGLPDPDIDPVGPATMTLYRGAGLKTWRGGNYQSPASRSRCAFFNFIASYAPPSFYGFRVARSVPATAPRFAISPVDREGSFGGTTTFSIVVGGAPTPAVRWQRAPAGSDVFTDLAEGGNHTGVATATLGVTLASGIQHGDRFRCIATNTSGTATSDAATLTLTGIPATVTLGALSRVYDGQPKAATATTNPGGLTVVLTYNGSATPPIAAGIYPVVGTISDPNYVGSANGTLTILPVVALAHPVTIAISAGGATTLSVAIQCGGSSTCQWQVLLRTASDITSGPGGRSAAADRWGDIPGATDPSFTIPSTQRFHGGSYRVVVSANGASITSVPVTLTVEGVAPSASRLLNLSARALCRTGNDIVIPGFVVSGTGTKRLLLRAVGPTLAQFGVAGALPDPRLTLKRWNGSAYDDVATNDEWGLSANTAEIARLADAVGAFPLAAGSRDAALLVELAPGRYTVLADDSAGASGVAIVELYVADSSTGDATRSRLINLSNRGYVGQGTDVMIPGFVISSEGAKTMLLRAVGPQLTEFGVIGVLADPKLTVYRSYPQTGASEVILANDNWGENGDAAEVGATATRVGAFGLAPDSKDSAFVVSLLPGVYTVHASGADGGTGVALVEVYVVE